MEQVDRGTLDFELANAQLQAFDHTVLDLARLANEAAQGFFDPVDGTTVLLADRIAPGTEAAVYLHEIVHARGMDVLGEDAFARLIKQVRAWGADNSPALEAHIYKMSSQRALASLKGLDDPHFDEELLAYAVEEAFAAGVRPTIQAPEGSAEQWLGDVVATLRGVVFDLTCGASPELDAQQLVNLAYALAQMENPERARLIRDALQASNTLDGRGEVVQSESFATWFGESKVVDQNGQPLVVFHGTADNVTEFDPGKVGLRHVDVEADRKSVV